MSPPIRESERARYPTVEVWQEIRTVILMRARNGCEGSPAYPDCRAINEEPHPETGSLVVLTVAHLDHQPENNALSNLRAWCQRCHLTYDAKQHAMNAARTRAAAKEQEGQERLFDK